MNDNAPSMMMPALIAGGALGFVSGSLPILELRVLCLWAARPPDSSQLSSIRRTANVQGSAFDAGKGGVLGLLTRSGLRRRRSSRSTRSSRFSPAASMLKRCARPSTTTR